MDNQRERGEHHIELDIRKHLEISGVREVLCFDDVSVLLKTNYGELNIDGREIKVSVLDTDKGVVILDGRIDAIYYTDDKQETKHGFFGRLLK